MLCAWIVCYFSNIHETEVGLFQCPKPVIAAIHNACIGAGVDMTSACDIRYATNDVFFQIKVGFKCCAVPIHLCWSVYSTVKPLNYGLLTNGNSFIRNKFSYINLFNYYTCK